MERRLLGQVALVTGASRGIGRAIALNLAEEGATVVVAARTATPVGGALGSLEQVAREINEAGGTAIPVAADLTVPADVTNLIKEVQARTSRIDVLVNNAAYMADGAYRSFDAMDIKEWHAQLDLNLSVPFLLMKAFAPAMVAARKGRILNLVSGSAYLQPAGATPLPGSGGVSGAYGATKAGLARLTNAMANEVHAAGVAVIAVDPGSTTTENRPTVARAFGFKVEGKHGTEVPARTIRYLATCADPMTYTGTIVTAAQFVVEKNLFERDASG